MPDSRTNREHASPFLRLSLEVRQQIYRNLLLEPPESLLFTTWVQEVEETQETQETPKRVWKRFKDDRFMVQRFPNILRTNCQIYDEASYLLYSELSVKLLACDVVCIGTGKALMPGPERTWRHNPLSGTGTTNASGLTVYARPELGGDVEPHVFARFKKIAFQLDFDWEMGARQTLEDENALYEDRLNLSVNNNLIVDAEDEAKLMNFYKRSTSIDQVAKVLSNSSDILRLDVCFKFDDLAVYYDDGSDSEADASPADKMENKMAKKTAVVKERGIEVFLDGGHLAPLEKLSNVRSFKFNYDFRDRNGEFYKPTPKHAKLLLDLKQKIERNYAARNR